MKFSHGPNLVLHCLMMTLTKIKPKGKVLYLQLDNTYKENKNSYLMRFMSYLVNQNYFEQIQVSFLLVGHTHNDVDMVFSLVSRKIFPCVITTLEIFKELVVDSTKKLEQDKVVLIKRKEKIKCYKNEKIK